MRHQCRVPKLGRPADQRKAMLRALTTQLIREGRLTTTKARAKALRDEAERMISLAKDGSLAARRRAIGYIYDKQLVHALFDKAQERYGDRNGGYTRIIKTGTRLGDNAEMAMIELVDFNEIYSNAKKEAKKNTRRSRAKVAAPAAAAPAAEVAPEAPEVAENTESNDAE